jgi:DNA-binding transcriptional MerR regulator
MTAPTAPTGVLDPAALGPVWTVAAVAARLGVAASTLRSWSLRYGIGPVGHQRGRHRRYTTADVAELDIMRSLIDQGVVVAAAAAMARERRLADQAAEAIGEDRAHVSVAVVRGLVAAARRLDPATAAGIVTATLARCGVVTTWNELCRPALVALDNPTLDNHATPGPGSTSSDSTGPSSCIDAELVLSRAVAASFHRLPTTSPRPHPVLLACAEGEQHTLGLEALLAALAEQHIDTRLLGTSVPDQVLLTAVDKLQPTAVVVWAQVADTAAPTLMRTLAARPGLVIAAGPGWDRAGLHPPVARAGSLQQAVIQARAAPRRVRQQRGDTG